MAKPTIVLVPGAWHKPSIYSSVIAFLSAHAYPTVALPLPSVGATPPNADFTEDIIAIRECLVRLVALEEKDVVLAVHSYSGMPGAEAPKGLGKNERQKNGLRGGVLRLVFIAAYVLPEGIQPVSDGTQILEWVKVDLEKGVANVEPVDAKEIFYNDLPSVEAEKWSSQLLHQSFGVFSSVTTYAAWRYIPSTYVIAENDKSTIFSPSAAEMMIKEAKKLEPSAFDVVERCDGGHCPMISCPQWIADVLRKAAGEVL